jgi:hypothetical protein
MGICCITPEIIAIAVDVPIALTPVCAAAAVEEAAAAVLEAAAAVLEAPFAVVAALSAVDAAFAATV